MIDFGFISSMGINFLAILSAHRLYTFHLRGHKYNDPEYGVEAQGIDWLYLFTILSLLYYN